MARKGLALVLSAPSGAGKSTLVQRLMAEFPTLSYSISCTTRQPRSDERPDVDYHFLSQEEFIAKRDQRYFAEWAYVHGHYYGTPLGEVNQKLAQGLDVVFDIDMQGAAKLKESLDSAYFVFILPPSIAELQNRLEKRGTDSVETITKRMQNAKQEIAKALWYDALIVNDDLDVAYEHLKACYLAATLAPKRNQSLLSNLLIEFDK